MADFIYNRYCKFLADGNATDDIRVMLLEAASDENKDDATITAVLARAGTTERLLAHDCSRISQSIAPVTLTVEPTQRAQQTPGHGQMTPVRAEPLRHCLECERTVRLHKLEETPSPAGQDNWNRNVTVRVAI